MPLSLSDKATLAVGAGNFFFAPEGSAALVPADFTDGQIVATGTAKGWKNLGHTQFDQIFNMEQEGGEKTVLKTLQNRTLRTKYSEITRTITINVHQLDIDVLKLYFGSNSVEINAGQFLGVPLKPEPTRMAFCCVFFENDVQFTIYAPSVDILGNEGVSIGETDQLVGLALQVTPVVYQTNTWTLAVSPLSKV